jgi:O-antigen/teichoic acid export membrane protein
MPDPDGDSSDSRFDRNRSSSSRYLQPQVASPHSSTARQRNAEWRVDWEAEWGNEPLPALGGDQSLTGPIAVVLPRVSPSVADASGNWSGDGSTPRLPTSSTATSIDELPTWILPAITPATVRSQTSTRLQAVVKGAESYAALLRTLARSSGIYALASVVSPMISLVLAPFLTRYLTLAEYGALAVFNTVISLTVGITQLGLGSAFFRAYNYDFTSRSGQRSVIATITVILMFVSSVVVSITVLNAQFVSQALFQTSAFTTAVALAAGAVLMQNLTVPGFAWLRAENKALYFSVLSILNLVIALIANIVLVGVLQLGLYGSLLATMTGYAAVALLTFPFLIIHSRLLLRMDVARSVLAFGAPMIFSVISFWILQLSDRYLLSLFTSLAITASYALAYNLGAVLNTVIMSPFMLAWPTAMFRIAKRHDAAQVYAVVFRWFSTLLLLAAFAFSIAGRMMLEWFFPPSYHNAEVIVPVIAGSLVFFGVYFFFMIGASLKRKTWVATLLTTLAAAVNVGLNLLLIPQFQALGAAASTMTAYIVMAALAYVINQRLYPVPFEVARFTGAFLLGAAIYAGGYLLTDLLGRDTNLTISVAGLVIYAFCLLVLIQRPVRFSRASLKRDHEPERSGGARGAELNRARREQGSGGE